MEYIQRFIDGEYGIYWLISVGAVIGVLWAMCGAYRTKKRAKRDYAQGNVVLVNQRRPFGSVIPVTASQAPESQKTDRGLGTFIIINVLGLIGVTVGVFLMLQAPREHFAWGHAISMVGPGFVCTWIMGKVIEHTENKVSRPTILGSFTILMVGVWIFLPWYLVVKISRFLIDKGL